MKAKKGDNKKEVNKAMRKGRGDVRGTRLKSGINGFNATLLMRGLVTAILVISVLAMFTAVASADTLNVNQTGWWRDGGTFNASSTPIQHAIDNATAGDTINVTDGTYTITAAINVNKGVTITGNITNPGNVLVKYNPASSALNCVEVNSADVTIQGIKVQDCKNGFHFNRNVNTYTGVTISNCSIENVSGWGIGEISSPNTVISHNTITTVGDMGIYFRKCEGTSESNRCEAISNVISGCGYPAIQTYFSKYAYIYDNTISSTNDKGVNILQSSATGTADRIQVIGNTISGCGYPAIQTDGGKYTYIYDNTISSTNDKGINIIKSGATGTADRIQVIGNTISETKWPGIQVIGSPYTYVYSNTLTKCNYYGGDSTGDWDYASIHVEDDGAVSGANVIIDNNTISDGINGIQIWSDNCTVTNNTIYDMGLTYNDTKGTGDGTYYNSGIIVGTNWLTNNVKPTGTTITNNNIHDNYWGLYVRNYTALSPEDPSVLSVTAEKNWWGHATGPGGQGPGTGDDVSTNVDYSPWLGYTVGTSPMTWHTNDNIQDAIDAANPGDTILVPDGTYNENIVVGKSLTIQAASSPIVQGSGGSGNHVFKVTANNVNISGFTVKSTGYCNNAGGIYLDTGVEGCNITGNNISEIKLGYGIYLKNANNNTVTSNNITKGTIEDWDNLASGIFLDSSNNNTIANNTAELETSSGTNSGIYLENSDGNTLTDNEASSNKNGIYLEYSDSNTVTGNTVSDNYHGFYIKASNSNTFTNNKASNPNNYGFYLMGSSDNEIKNNTVSSNTNWGIYLNNAPNTEITGNTITSNGQTGQYGGIYLHQATDASTVSVHFNNIEGNQNYGVYNNNANTLDAENNWWGDVSGPSGSGYGTGDTVSDNVDYDPWLDASYPGGQPIYFTGAQTNTTESTGTTEINATAETNSSITINTNAAVNVTIAAYSHNPGTGLGGAVNKHIDVHIDNPAGVTNMTITLFYTAADIVGIDENILRMRWWDGDSWVRCSNTGVNTTDQGSYSGYIWAYIDNTTTTPMLWQLTGSGFGAGSPVDVTIQSTAALPGENNTVLIIADDGGNHSDNMSLAQSTINVSFNSSVVHVTGVATGSVNALNVVDSNIQNGAGWVKIVSVDGSEPHNGTVTLAVLTLEAVGPDTVNPSVTNPIANVTHAFSATHPATILNDVSPFRARPPGANVSQLNVTVVDRGELTSALNIIEASLVNWSVGDIANTPANGTFTQNSSGVSTVTVNLSVLNGSAAQTMTRFSGSNIWSVTTNASAGINNTNNLVFNATDNSSNSNTSANVDLTVLRRGDVIRNNKVDGTDLLRIAKYITGKEPTIGEFIAGVWPANVYDGVVNGKDMLYIAKYVVGTETAP